jgi:uncharacterized membrane protein YccC
MFISEESRSACRQAICMTLAALFAFLVTRWLGLPQGYWAVITCLAVVQGSVSATVNAGVARFAGTAVGALFSSMCLFLLMNSPIPVWATLLVLIAPLSIIAALWPLFRLAPLTGGLVLLLAGSSGIDFAFGRVVEIGVGGIIGIIVSFAILPQRPIDTANVHCAEVLRQLATSARAQVKISDMHLLQTEFKTSRNAFLQMQSEIKEPKNKRIGKSIRELSPEILIGIIQQVRSDMEVLRHAIKIEEPSAYHEELSTAVASLFAAEAEALVTKRPAPSFASLDSVIQGFSTKTPLGFMLSVLRRDLADLHKSIDDRVEWSTRS